ncbi:hypothetical protein CF326_g594 [Tilletia indica]|nr:hypothetical protein CF326_g594 [Tilletia indica]
MSSSQEDANSASWREEQRSSSQSPPASPNATPPSAQPHKSTTTAAMPRASPCGSDKILESTDEERALASFSFQAPAFLSKKKSNDPISTENTTRPLQKAGSFFRQPLRPLNPGQSSLGTSAAKEGNSTAPTAQRGDKSSQETIHATDKTPATPAPSKTAQAAGQKRNADFASLTPFLSRTATSTPALLTKRPRPSSPLIPAHARGNKSVKELLSSRSASMAFRPEGSSAGHGMRKMPAADSPMMQSLLFGMRSSGSVAASQSSSQLTPAVQSNAISSASLGDTQSTQTSELPNSASKVRDTQSSDAFSDQEETSTAPAATLVEHAQPTDADPMDKSRPMHQERSSSPSEASQSPPPPAQPQAVARILPAPVELSIEKRHPTHSIGADSDITDVWAWLVRQRERCTDLETQLQIKDANILAIEDLKRAKEQELEVLRCRTEKLVATIGEQTKDLTGFRETMAKQQLDNEERNLLLEERSRELQRFQEELSHTLKRDNEERSRLEEEISSAREQLGELRAQRDAGLDMIKETKDRLQQALYDLAEARDQVRNLEKNKDELVEKMMRKEEEASELTHKTRSLDKALAEHERHKTEREQLHQKLEAQLQDHLQRIEELQQQKAELLSEKTGLDARVASLEQDIDKAHENEAAVTKLHDEAQVQLSRTTTRNAELEAQTTELSREVERLKLDAQERQEVLKTTHAERVESGAMCNELQQKLGLAEVSLARVEAELAAAKQHSAALSGRLEQLSQKATQHTTEAADAKRDKAVAESAYESCKLTLDELKGLSKTLQHQLEDKERQLNEYLKQSRDGSAQSHAELARLQGKYEVASERIGTISQQLIESEDRRAALSAELAQLKETVQRKNRDSENNQVQDNAALQRLREDLASVTRERDGLTDQIGVNAQEVEKLQAELQRTQEELQLQAVDAEDGRRAIEREKTLMTRYQSGQLTEAETQLLAQAIASNAEQVTREISKRDNVIKGLEYEKRSFLDKLKKAQQEIESARKGSAQINAPRRSIALPASEPSSEADHQSTSSRVRFTGVEQVKTGQVQGGAGPSTTASIPSRSGAAKITRQYASRSQSLRPSASSGRRSVAGSALQALSQQPRDDDEVSNDADSMQNNEASSSTNPIGATSTENEQDSSTSVHTRRTVRRVRLS